ncbi:MAG: polysaccharide deacetylase family protein [Planctomycetota bacterium]
MPLSLITLCLSGCAALQRRALPVAERLSPLGVFRVHGIVEKTVALTIDDGPSRRSGDILDLLRGHGATATFFIHTDHVEETAGGEELVERMLSEGHEVGNHMPADVPSATLDAETFATEFRRSDARLRQLGVSPRWFRPAGGGFVDKRMGPVLDEFGYEHRYMLGSYLPWDVAVGAPNSYADQLIAGVFPGAILVLHDGDHAHAKRLDHTLVTLERLLERLSERGYQARSLSTTWSAAGSPAAGE